MTPAHKPLFLLTGLSAGLFPMIWFWPNLLPDPVFWHLHELGFGMAGAAIGGYLLIALPHGTGHQVGRRAVWLLALAWIIGRGAQVLDMSQTAALIAAAICYPVTLMAVLLPPLIRARAWHRGWIAVLPTGLATADAALLLSRQNDTLPEAVPQLLVLGFALMIGAIGGRLVPAFTQSRIARCGGPERVQKRAGLGRLSALATGLAMIGFAAGIPSSWTGGALLAAGLGQIARMSGWQSWSIRRQPDILMLHLAWVWLAFGLGLTGCALIWPQGLPERASLHALTMGAMGSMIFAVAARANMARKAGRLLASADMIAAFTLISAAAALRIFFAEWQAFGFAGLHWSVLCWSSAWLLFVWRIVVNWRQPPPFPILSASMGSAGGDTGWIDVHAGKPRP